MEALEREEFRSLQTKNARLHRQLQDQVKVCDDLYSKLEERDAEIDRLHAHCHALEARTLVNTTRHRKHDREQCCQALRQEIEQLVADLVQPAPNPVERTAAVQVIRAHVASEMAVIHARVDDLDRESAERSQQLSDEIQILGRVHKSLSDLLHGLPSALQRTILASKSSVGERLGSLDSGAFSGNWSIGERDNGTSSTGDGSETRLGREATVPIWRAPQSVAAVTPSPSFAVYSKLWDQLEARARSNSNEVHWEGTCQS